jgi:hypothetical protein
VSDAGLASAQMQWADGPGRVRRVRAGLDERGRAAVDRAEAELGRAITQRLGPSYTLHELLRVYLDSDAWAVPVVTEAMAPRVMLSAVTPLVDAAFERAASAARDA